MINFLVLINLISIISEISSEKVLQSRIIGGVNTNIDEIPWQVSLQFNDFNSHFCGGTAINSKTILTAAHCCANLQTLISSLRVRAKSSKYTSGGQLCRVIKVIPHPAYNERTTNNDICIIKLLDEISTSFALLPELNSEIITGENILISGWGFKFEGSSALSTQLQSVIVQAIDFQDCNKSYNNKLTNNMFCAGNLKGGKDACTNDSGGPAVINNQTLVGIVSFGKGCGLKDYPTVYTKVSKLLPWIQNYLD